MTATVWPSVLTSTLAAVYRADQADPTLRRTREIIVLEAEAHGGTAEDAQRAIEVWESRGCLTRHGLDWRITDQGRDEAKRLIQARRVAGSVSATWSLEGGRPSRRGVRAGGPGLAGPTAGRTPRPS